MNEDQKKLIVVMDFYNKKEWSDKDVRNEKIKEFINDNYEGICDLLVHIKDNEEFIEKNQKLIDCLKENDIISKKKTDDESIKKFKRRWEEIEKYEKEEAAKGKEAIEKEKLKKNYDTNEEKIKTVLKELNGSMVRRSMNPFTHFIRNKKGTEKYYHWLLPYAKSIEHLIPGFEKSWSNNRRSFDGMKGLVKAAIYLMEGK